MTYEEQIDKWVEGESIHKKDTNECCPDFSCCKPENLASKEERVQFKNSNRSTRDSMLFLFLGRMLKKEGYEVKS